MAESPVCKELLWDDTSDYPGCVISPHPTGRLRQVSPDKGREAQRGPEATWAEGRWRVERQDLFQVVRLQNPTSREPLMIIQ